MSTATQTPTAPTPLMSFPSASGVTVEVQAVPGDYLPYRWVCPAGHGGHGYASLPFCRDDAKAHAAECPGLPLEIRKAVVRYGICLETYARLAMMDARNMSGAQFTLMAEAQDELTQRHEQLEQAGMLHLVVAS